MKNDVKRFFAEIVQKAKILSHFRTFGVFSVGAPVRETICFLRAASCPRAETVLY